MSRQNERERKRKMELAEIGEMRKQRVSLQNSISTLEKDIVKYSIEAEEKQSFAFLTKANSFRKTVEEKVLKNATT